MIRKLSLVNNKHSADFTLDKDQFLIRIDGEEETFSLPLKRFLKLLGLRSESLPELPGTSEEEFYKMINSTELYELDPYTTNTNHLVSWLEGYLEKFGAEELFNNLKVHVKDFQIPNLLKIIGRMEEPFGDENLRTDLIKWGLSSKEVSIRDSTIDLCGNENWRNKEILDELLSKSEVEEVTFLKDYMKTIIKEIESVL